MKKKRIVPPGEIVNPEVFEKAIRNGLNEKFPKKYSYKSKRNFSPSKIGFGGGKCPRYWYYHFKGDVEQEDTGNYQSKLKRLMGTNNHEMFEGLIGDVEGWVSEIAVSSDYPPIYGYVDIHDTKNNVPVEMKNTDDGKFREAKENNVLQESHLIQLLIYMKLLKAKQGVVLLINRETLEMHAVSVMINQRYIDYMDALFDWMNKVRNEYNQGNMAERPQGYTADSFPCSWCPFKKACWSDKNEGDYYLDPVKDLTNK